MIFGGVSWYQPSLVVWLELFSSNKHMRATGLHVTIVWEDAKRLLVLLLCDWAKTKQVLQSFCKGFAAPIRLTRFPDVLLRHTLLPAAMDDHSTYGSYTPAPNHLRLFSISYSSRGIVWGGHVLKPDTTKRNETIQTKGPKRGKQNHGKDQNHRNERNETTETKAPKWAKRNDRSE